MSKNEQDGKLDEEEEEESGDEGDMGKYMIESEVYGIGIFSPFWHFYMNIIFYWKQLVINCHSRLYGKCVFDWLL